MKTLKRYDDYLPGETRAQYVKRRAKPVVLSLKMYWPTCFVRHDGQTVLTNGTFAGKDTQEYRRIKAIPQVANHIKKIDKMFKEVT